MVKGGKYRITYLGHKAVSTAQNQWKPTSKEAPGERWWVKKKLVSKVRVTETLKQQREGDQSDDCHSQHLPQPTPQQQPGF
jgi:hypothetical protein